MPINRNATVDTAKSIMQKKESRHIRITAGGPILVEGPVDVEMPDGSIARSDRFVVALCACRRSKTLPFCDTSHRKRCGIARNSKPNL